MSWPKNFGVIFCLFGVGLIGFGTNDAQDDNVKNTWYGIVECLLAMFGFGVMEVLIAIFGKKYFSNKHDEDEEEESKMNKINSKLFMTAIIGFCGCLTLWPGLFILHWTQVEEFELPSTNDEVLSIAVPAIMDTVYAAAFIVGISVMDPVFMAVAQIFVVPVSFIFDVVFNGLVISVFAVVGSLLILIGFLLTTENQTN